METINELSINMKIYLYIFLITKEKSIFATAVDKMKFFKSSSN